MPDAGTLKINEIFPALQGEGSFAGCPMLFIRLAGCNLSCDFCDTEFSTKETLSVKTIADIIKKSKLDTVCWTGGEPLLQADKIKEVIRETSHFSHHLETNGTIQHDVLHEFEYIAFSPKDGQTAEEVRYYTQNKIQGYTYYDIKVVTDLDTVGLELLEYATMLMPLTLGTNLGNDTRCIDRVETNIIANKVWDYCLKHKMRYSPRLHMDLNRK